MNSTQYTLSSEVDLIVVAMTIIIIIIIMMSKLPTFLIHLAGHLLSQDWSRENKGLEVCLSTGIDGGITSRRYAEEMLTEVFIIYLMNAIQQVVMTSCPKIIT